MSGLDLLPSRLAKQARIYEGEPYWPLTRAGEVVDALARAGRAVTGIEQMRFEAGFTGPRVLRFSSYRLKSTASWSEVAEDARLKAHAALTRMSGEDTVCQISWCADPAT